MTVPEVTSSTVYFESFQTAEKKKTQQKDTKMSYSETDSQKLDSNGLSTTQGQLGTSEDHHRSIRIKNLYRTCLKLYPSQFYKISPKHDKSHNQPPEDSP